MAFYISVNSQKVTDVPVYLKRHDNGIAHYVFYPVVVTIDSEKKWIVERCEIALHLTVNCQLLLDRSWSNFIGQTKYEKICTNQSCVGFISYQTSKAIIDKALLHKSVR